MSSSHRTKSVDIPFYFYLIVIDVCREYMGLLNVRKPFSF